MFDLDDLFLVETFEDIVSALPKEYIYEAKINGSYYDFHIKTTEYIIVPLSINFTFKYVHLIKQYSPDYWDKLTRGWSKLISPLFGDPQDSYAKSKINLVFDNIYSSDHYNIMPPVIKKDDTFVYFKNLESVSTPLNLSVLAAYKFSKLYSNPVEHQWNEHVNVYVFPVNDISFYGMVDNRLTMLYPKWNSHRWSSELPKFIVDTRNLSSIVKFKPFNIYNEQETIRLMNGAPDKEFFK